VRPGPAAILLGRTEVVAMVVADTALLRAARGRRAAGRLGRTGVVGANLRGAAMAAMRRAREDRSDD
jgi:hypothetical protein